MSKKVVYIVHCVDTEGPLAERPFTLNNFRTARKEDRRFNPREWKKDSDAYIQGHRAHVLNTWEEVFRALDRVTSQRQRKSFPDSRGGKWKFNWFCMDHIDFLVNPRRRDMGLHNIFDVYDNLVKEQNLGDRVHWHFHPKSTYSEGHMCASSYVNSPMLYEILCRRLIERKWFPCVNRAGFQDERQDGNWFLEQWIPFDYSNTSTDDLDADKNPDLLEGRLSDWRWAPRDWSTYHPSHDCCQIPGNCRRQVARCLNVLNRFANLDETEMHKAFARADAGLPTILSFASHDWRDMNVEVEFVKYLIKKVQSDFPKVQFQYMEAVEAFRALNGPGKDKSLKLQCTLRRSKGNLPMRIDVEMKEGEVFGPQPFLAIQTKSHRFIHDNLNYWRSLRDWFYSFDNESIHPEDVKAIGIAANDKEGNQSIHVIDMDSVENDDGAICF